MEANELRLGNYVSYCQSGDVSIVNGVYSDVDILLDFARVFTKDLFGIPLTIEWLERFGFEQECNNDEYFKEYGKDCLSIVIEYFEYTNAYHFTGGEGIRNGIGCIFVHQLQNLYFALTGEELK
jgi:hypothetical protein